MNPLIYGFWDGVFYDNRQTFSPTAPEDLPLDQFSQDRSTPRESHFAALISRAFPEDYRLAGILGRTLEQASGQPLTPEQLAYLTVNLHRVNRG